MTTNDKDTFFSRAIADPDKAGGRYAKLNTAKVTGSTPTPTVPQQPAISPWACDLVPLEPPLGFSVDDLGVARSDAALSSDVETSDPPNEKEIYDDQ
jgi:hypothetical protein